MGKLKISGIVKESIVDGPGIRYVIFTQGCPHHCIGCHNPQTHDFNGGKYIDTETLYEEIVKDPLLKGVTFSGGEPFMQAEVLSDLAKKIKQRGMDVISYSGFKFEDLIENSNDNNKFMDLLESIDILIDGKFEQTLKNPFLKFRGSENQRIISCKDSIECGKIVTVEL